MSSGSRRFFILGAVTLAALVVLPVSTRRHPWQERHPSIRCAIDLRGDRPGSATVALSRMMFNKFAEDFHLDADIRVREDGSDYLDSLREGHVDLVAMYQADSLDGNGLVTSRPFNDSTVWVLRDDDPASLKAVNTWLAALTGSGHFRRLSKTFLQGKVSSLTSISAYDVLIRRNAEEMGWDWRLLSAMIFHESRFTNEASSDKGAVGLMQVRSGRYSVDTLLDPAVNIAVGTRYLSRLQRMFLPYAADTTECLKFALAAYNAGEGNILKSIQYAQRHGVDASRWDSIVSILPEVPGFSGRQTIAYVDGVLDTYEDYVTVYPK
ncbi:MAG: transglycosylase SLT domain-containing protein [Bacteroidales bacterium]|nr:transglycosylase SLT domain-containing protein [Bacteroidales bacterium]